MRSVALVVVLLAACGRDGKPTADSVVTVAPATIGATTAPAVAAGEKPVCPATGVWSACAIMERLERSGLVPRLDSAGADEPPLVGKGLLIRLGRGDLEVYLYPDVASRERAQATLDRARYLEYGAASGIDQQATLIASANALVILHSRNDHQRERVGDAITAGPPNRQP